MVCVNFGFTKITFKNNMFLLLIALIFKEWNPLLRFCNSKLFKEVGVQIDESN